MIPVTLNTFLEYSGAGLGAGRECARSGASAPGSLAFLYGSPAVSCYSVGLSYEALAIMLFNAMNVMAALAPVALI